MPDELIAPPGGVLLGRRIVITRSRSQSAGLAERLAELGAEPVICPAIAIAPPESWAPLDEALGAVERYDWVVFTSANAVDAVVGRLAEGGLAPAGDGANRVSRGGAPGPGLGRGRAKLAAVGAATAAALFRSGLHAAAVPEHFLGAEIPAALGSVHGQRILLPRSQIAAVELPDALRAAGALVDEVVAYRTLAAPELPTLAREVARGGVDAITFASPSALRYFVGALHDAGCPEVMRGESGRPMVVCIGPVTAEAARALSVPVDAVAGVHDSAGLIAALVRCLAAPHDTLPHDTSRS